jgi:hypothetical protein
MLQVDREAFLVPVEYREEARACVLQVARVVALQRLDLDDFGAEVREDEAAGGAHDHVRELDHPHALERKHR